MATSVVVNRSLAVGDIISRDASKKRAKENIRMNES
jgi:hypothetical protein